MLTVEWPTDKTLQFVQEYKSRPVLWNREHRHYRIGDRKFKAWAEMAAIFKTESCDLKKKMNSLLASYRRERHKCRAHPGKPGEPGFRSTWFAYKAFAFLQGNKNFERRNYTRYTPNADDQGESTDVECIEQEAEIDFVKYENPDEENPLAANEDLTILNDIEEQPYDEDWSAGPSRKRPRQNEDDPGYTQEASSSLHERRERDEADVFGEYVSGKMRTFDHKTKCVVQYLMGNILFQADMGKFKDDSVDCDHVMRSLLTIFSDKSNVKNNGAK